MSKINVANPLARDMTRGTYGRWQTYLFSFGAYGDTHVLTYGSGMDSALEEAAEWLADNAPGHLMAHDSEELSDLFTEAVQEFEEEHGREPDDEERCECFDKATTDLTYTEAGYLTSYEWTVRENPSKADLIRLAKGR